jgi:hypothetical protein
MNKEISDLMNQFSIEIIENFLTEYKEFELFGQSVNFIGFPRKKLEEYLDKRKGNLVLQLIEEEKQDEEEYLKELLEREQNY